MAHWTLDRYLYVEEAGADVERHLGDQQPFAIERLQPGLVLVYTRRRVTLRSRLWAWITGLRANGENDGQPEDSEAAGGTRPAEG